MFFRKKWIAFINQEAKGQVLQSVSTHQHQTFVGTGHNIILLSICYIHSKFIAIFLSYPQYYLSDHSAYYIIIFCYKWYIVQTDSLLVLHMFHGRTNDHETIFTWLYHFDEIKSVILDSYSNFMKFNSDIILVAYVHESYPGNRDDEVCERTRKYDFHGVKLKSKRIKIN